MKMIIQSGAVEVVLLLTLHFMLFIACLFDNLFLLSHSYLASYSFTFALLTFSLLLTGSSSLISVCSNLVLLPHSSCFRFLLDHLSRFSLTFHAPCSTFLFVSFSCFCSPFSPSHKGREHHYWHHTIIPCNQKKPTRSPLFFSPPRTSFSLSQLHLTPLTSITAFSPLFFPNLLLCLAHFP